MPARMHSNPVGDVQLEGSLVEAECKRHCSSDFQAIARTERC